MRTKVGDQQHSFLSVGMFYGRQLAILKGFGLFFAFFNTAFVVYGRSRCRCIDIEFLEV